MYPQLTALGGMLKTYKLITTASTNANVVSDVPAAIYGGWFHNIAAYDVFVKFYDRTTNATVGTTVPIYTLGIKTLTTVPLVIPGIPHVNGIAIAVTKFLQDTDNTDVGANDLTLALWYKR